jgi:hypothetical protein
MGGQGQSGSSTEDEDFNEDLWDFIFIIDFNLHFLKLIHNI